MTATAASLSLPLAAAGNVGDEGRCETYTATQVYVCLCV